MKEQEPMFPQMENRAIIERLIDTLGVSMGSHGYDTNDESEAVLTDIKNALSKEKDEAYIASVHEQIEKIKENHLNPQA